MTTTAATNNKIRLTSSPSPITTATVALSGYSYSQLRPFKNGSVSLCCRDPSNQGKSCIQVVDVANKHKKRRGGQNEDPASSVISTTTWTHPTHDVRSAVHEYGGGAYCVLDDGFVYTNFPNHILSWKKSVSEKAVPLRPADAYSYRCRYADFSILKSKDGSMAELLCVMEDHYDPKPSNVLNSIAVVSLQDLYRVRVLASGRDFYASPCVDDDGSQQLAYVAWDHPNMPWDNTTLYVQNLAVSEPPIPIHSSGGSSVYAPQWYDGKLYFLSNTTGWYNLYCWDKATTTCVLSKSADFSEPSCGWILGVNCYTFLADGRIAATYCDKTDGSQVVLIDTKNQNAAQYFGRSCLPPTSISSLTASGDSLYFLGGSPKQPTGVWCWERPGADSCVATEVVSSMQDQDLTTIQSYMSEPQLLRFPSDSALGLGYAYGYYYPPIEKVRPTAPLLVKAHGGPTSQTSTTFRLDIQFWTSRGFAVLDVDYGGSSGYGKEFQQSLQGQWGLLDVADVCHGAQYCVEQGWVNPDWLCIDGGSAGGYTTLAALTFADTFRAGASKYGIGDLTKLAEGTHKFESRYLEGLVGGPYPNKKYFYKERSPVNFSEQLNCPVILLQGDEDKVVPPDQAEQMFHELTSKGIPSALMIYKGEQHGFRKSDNISHALLSEYFFFCETFSFEPQTEGNFKGVKVGARAEV